MKQRLGSYTSDDEKLEVEVYTDGTTEVTIWGVSEDSRDSYADVVLSKDELVSLHEFLSTMLDPIA